MRRLLAATASATLAVALAGCGDVPAEVAEVPVVVAEPVAPDAAGIEAVEPAEDPAPVDEVPAEPDAAATPSASTSAAPDDTADDDGPMIGPTTADAAAFVRSDALADLSGLEHVVVDLDGDTWAEVVATGTVGRKGVVRVAWWTADGYEVLAADEAGPGTDVSDLRASDLNADGTIEVLVRVEGDGRRSLSLWAVPRRASLAPLRAVGGCHDGTHVYGVTRARLEARPDGPPVVVADCDDSPLPVADWSERRWVWSGEAYELEAAPTPSPTPSPSPVDPDGDGDDDDDGEDD